MNKKYWIIFIIAVNVIIIAGVAVYFKMQGKEFSPKKVEIQKVENPITEVIAKDSSKSIFVSHGMTPKEQKLLGQLFDKLSYGNDNAEIAFYNNAIVGYFHDSSRVYWYKKYSDKYSKIDCDREDFKILDNNKNIEIGLCKKSVFIRGVKDYRLDGESIVLNYGNYLSDKKNMYYKYTYFDRKNGVEKTEINPVDGNPTQIDSTLSHQLGNEFATANGKLLFRSKQFSEIDLSSFKRIKNSYYSDKKSYYYLSQQEGPLFIASVSSFTLLPFENKDGDNYVKIGKEVYLKNTRLVNANSDRLKPFDAENRREAKPKLISCTEGCSYVWDGRNIYFEGRRIVNADPKTFRLLGYGLIGGSMGNPRQPDYARDKHSVYYGDKIVSLADPLSFEPIVSGKFYFEYGKDRDSVFFENKKINRADPRTFVPLSDQPYEGCMPGKYSKDKSNIFYKWDIMKDVDYDTFEVVVAENGDYSKDKNGYYLGTENANESDWGVCQMG